MPLIQWDARYTVGVQRLGLQHRQLVALINQLHDAMAVGQGNQVIGSILDSLIYYTLRPLPERTGNPLNRCCGGPRRDPRRHRRRWH